jgi:hypothetical protein
MEEKDPHRKHRSYIKLVDSFPGMGKTDGAIITMKECVESKKGIILYAGPTCKLLKEVEKRLCSALGIDKHPSVIPIHSSAMYGSGDPMHERVIHLIDGTIKARSHLKLVEEGSVVLITHKTFMQLPRYLKNKEKVTVIFDEAYKCVFDPVEVKLKGKEVKIFERHLGIPRGNSNDYLKLEKISSLNKIRKDLAHLETKKSGKQLFEILDSIRKESSEVYVKITGESSSRFEFQEVKIPSTMFDGWDCVYLMSAFLKTTQLWALLTRGYFKLDGIVYKQKMDNYGDWEVQESRKKLTLDSRMLYVIMNDVTADFIPNYEKRLEQFRKRYESATILALTEGTMLSRNQLNSVLVPQDTYDEKQEELRTLINSMRDKKGRVLDGKHLLRLTRSELFEFAFAPDNHHTITKPVHKILEWFNSLDIIARDPYKWYLKHAVNMAMRWMEKRKCLHLKQKIPIGKRFHINLVPQKPLVLLNVAEQDRAMANSKIMDQIQLLPFECAGINEFRDHRVTIFLAALNARPSHQNFYSSILPWYNPKQDYAVASAVQAVTRGILRNHKSKKSALIIVSDIEMAMMLKDRLLGAPTIVKGADYDIPNVRALEFSVRSINAIDRQKFITIDPIKKAQRAKTQTKTGKKRYAISEADVRKNSPYFGEMNKNNVRMTRMKKAAEVSIHTQDDKAEVIALEKLVKSLRQQHSDWAKQYRKELKAKQFNSK